VRCRSRDAVAFVHESRAIFCRALAGRCGQGADGGEALAKLVMKLTSHVLAFVVLQGDEPAGQLVALGEGGAEAFGEVIEHVADRGELCKIERRQAR
jgi:hypothetical protein